MNKAYLQIIFLLERYSSREYFEVLVESWEKFVSFNEACNSRFSINPPLDIRGRPLHDQGDIWSTILLPNFRRTSGALRNALHRITHGDLTGLAVANRVLSDAKGQQDYSQDWMNPAEQDNYANLLALAQQAARNIVITEDAGWHPSDLSTRYYAPGRGPLALPDIMPTYRVNRQIVTRSGMPVLVPGIYMPDIEHSDPQFLTKRKDAAPPATVLLRLDEKRAPDGTPIGMDPITRKADCTWHLIERTDHYVSRFARIP